MTTTRKWEAPESSVERVHAPESSVEHAHAQLMRSKGLDPSGIEFPLRPDVLALVEHGVDPRPFLALPAPIGTLRGQVEDPFRWIGPAELLAHFDFARACGPSPTTRDQAVALFSALGYQVAPDALRRQVRMAGVSNPATEVLMMRPKAVGVELRRAESEDAESTRRAERAVRRTRDSIAGDDTSYRTTATTVHTW